MPQIPTTVFSGFLGSGKTTIIAHLIDELQAEGQQVVYIKNEIGNENVDGALMQGKQIQTKELLNGCICCTLVGPFVSAIEEIIAQFSPDRIIIEASGAADPAAIALMIDSNQKLKRDGVIAIVDVVNFQGYKDISLTARNQTKFTDLIVFNKIELASLGQKQAVVGYVRELNDHSPIIEAPQGTVRSSVIFGADPRELNHLLDSMHATHESHAGHLDQDGIDSVVVTFAQPPTTDQVQMYLSQLPATVFRVKGLLRLADGSLCLINKVAARSTIEPFDQPLPHPPDTAALVLIGFHLQDQLDLIMSKLVN